MDEVHTPRNMPYQIHSDDSQLDILERNVDVAAVQNSLAHMSMPHNTVRNARRPQANSPGVCCATRHSCDNLLRDVLRLCLKGTAETVDVLLLALLSCTVSGRVYRALCRMHVLLRCSAWTCLDTVKAGGVVHLLPFNSAAQIVMSC